MREHLSDSNQPRRDPVDPLDLVNRLYGNKDPFATAGAFLDRLHDLLPFQCAALMPIDPVTHEIQPGHYRACPPDFPTLYLDRWAASDPCLLRGECPNGLNTSVSLTPLVQAGHWCASAAPEMRAALGFEHAVGAIAGWRDRPLALLRLQRSAGEPDFTAAELATLDRIVPHIASSIALGASSPWGGIDSDAGLLVLDQRHRLLFNNDAAVEILSTLEPGAILHLAYSDSLWRNRETGNYRLRAIPLTSRSTLHWLRQADQAGTSPSADGIQPPAQERTRLTILLLEPLQRRRAVTSRLRHSRLSRREIEVALAVMRGLPNAAIAAELSIDEKTVKDHLRRIYGKIEVRSRTGMISKILGLDAELPLAPARGLKGAMKFR